MNGFLHKTDPQTLALAAVAGGEALHALSAFLPSTFTVKTLALGTDPSGQSIPQKLGNLRAGYVPAFALGTGLGLALSLIAESWLPLAFAVSGSLAGVTLYEGNLPANLRLDPVSALVAGALAGQLAGLSVAPAANPVIPGTPPVNAPAQLPYGLGVAT